MALLRDWADDSRFDLDAGLGDGADDMWDGLADDDLGLGEIPSHLRGSR
jgi:hypothetical protein